MFKLTCIEFLLEQLELLDLFGRDVSNVGPQALLSLQLSTHVS